MTSRIVRVGLTLVLPFCVSLCGITAGQATLFVQDVYQGLERHVKRGQLKTIRVIREMPKTVRIDYNRDVYLARL